MKTKKKYSKNYIFKYLSTICSWTLFIYLLLIAAFLLFYFVNIKILNRNKISQPISIYTIVSGSMIPTIDVYDVVVNVEVESPEDIKIGDIITFISQSSISRDLTVTHRVKDIQVVNGEYQYTTKGDNNITQDSAPATFDHIVGKAIFRIPQLGRVQTFIASKFGWLVIVIIPALYVILKDVVKLIKISSLQEESNNEKKKIMEKDKKVPEVTKKTPQNSKKTTTNPRKTPVNNKNTKKVSEIKRKNGKIKRYERKKKK